ncbi:MAG: DoxX family protein [bacterium]|nr:DoxX family protein [bacterium]
MTRILELARQTTSEKPALILRALAGIPLLAIGAQHFIDPESFRQILLASGVPFVGPNLILAPAVEVIAGVLLLAGVFGRIGGLLGVATMVPAVAATLVLAGLDPAALPAGVTAVPEVPPLPLPLVVLLASGYVAWRGAGAYSLDARSAAPARRGARRPALRRRLSRARLPLDSASVTFCADPADVSPSIHVGL